MDSPVFYGKIHRPFKPGVLNISIIPFFLSIFLHSSLSLSFLFSSSFPSSFFFSFLASLSISFFRPFSLLVFFFYLKFPGARRHLDSHPLPYKSDFGWSNNIFQKRKPSKSNGSCRRKKNGYWEAQFSLKQRDQS